MREAVLRITTQGSVRAKLGLLAHRAGFHSQLVHSQLVLPQLVSSQLVSSQLVGLSLLALASACWPQILALNFQPHKRQ